MFDTLEPKMFKPLSFLIIFPLALLLLLLPMILRAGISDFSKGALIGILLGLALIALVKGKKKAR